MSTFVQIPQRRKNQTLTFVFQESTPIETRVKKERNDGGRICIFITGFSRKAFHFGKLTRYPNPTHGRYGEVGRKNFHVQYNEYYHSICICIFAGW